MNSLMSPKIQDDDFVGRYAMCPKCEEPVAFDLWNHEQLICKYCPNCGQGIDWSDDYDD